MNTAQTIASGFSRWIDDVAGTVANVLARLSNPRTVTLIQDNNDEFLMRLDTVTSSRPSVDKIRIGAAQVNSPPADVAALLSGSRVKVILKPDQFLFRPLELPRRAGEFLQGIVRAQIDRLTPWDASSAAFGWSRPVPTIPDRMTVTIAATALSLIKPLVDTLAKW